MAKILHTAGQRPHPAGRPDGAAKSGAAKAEGDKIVAAPPEGSDSQAAGKALAALPESGQGGAVGKRAPWASPLDSLCGRRILLIVTGGVAAYKAAELARLLSKSGALVRVAMTEAAQRFVAPLTFASLTLGPVASDMWERDLSADPVAHVSWAKWAELLIVAPATADFLAKMAQGLAGDFASASALACQSPKLLAPAMNDGMFLNPATRANLATLSERGHIVLESPEGLLACGTVGAGRMAEPEIIAWEAARAIARGPLEGRRVVVTGGATREMWDDIRF